MPRTPIAPKKLAMPPSESSSDEKFSRRDAANTKALMAALDDLCQATGRTLEDFERLSMREIYDLAAETYGQQLPEFWRIWHEWNLPGQFQKMGDL
jgi:hypothetical protein